MFNDVLGSAATSPTTKRPSSLILQRSALSQLSAVLTDRLYSLSFVEDYGKIWAPDVAQR